MKLYITRHGQVTERDTLPFEEASKFPSEERPLSALGREQAELLGKHLKSLGFCGKILCSPFIRTLETASIIADITDSVIIPIAALREIFSDDEMAQNYRGMTIEEIKATYPRVDSAATLPDNWWCEEDGIARGETTEQVLERVKSGFSSALRQLLQEKELLTVGHAASAISLIRMYNIRERADTITLNTNCYRLFNCSLSMTDTDDTHVVPIYCDTSYLPYEKCTSNYKTREEYDAEFFASGYENEIPIPEELTLVKGKRILHIGDTFSCHYPYYRKLIETVKPDIILHTGDMADEVKAGRIPGLEYEYRFKIKALLDIMSKPQVPIIIVPGNNDIEAVIRELAPQAQVYKKNSVIDIDGHKCRVGHQVRNMTFDCPWNFYGHGPTGDEWSLDKNTPGVNWRFNATWGAFVYILEHNKYFHFPVPEIFLMD